ncbi:MAG: S41 family peptidase [Bacteroidota bacterium]
MTRLVLLVLLVGSGTAMAQSWRPVLNDAGIDPALHGVWQSRGYGWVFDIRQDGATGYDVSAAGCLGEEAQTTEEMSAWARVFSVEGESVQIASQPQNATRYVLDPIPVVPSACASPLGDSPREVFAYAWQVMAEHYAFFDLYGIDWDARRADLEPRVEEDMSDADLFDVLVELLEGIEDAHLVLQAEVDGEPRRHRGKGAQVLGPLLEAAFAAQDSVASMGAFANAWFMENQRRIQEDVLDAGTVVVLGNNDAVWGRRGQAGYLFIGGMGGTRFGDGLPFEEQLAAVDSVLDRALLDLADTEALVLDVALNQGGSDRIGLAIAGHFTNTVSTGVTKTAHGAEGVDPQPISLRPASGVRYLKPVALLTTGVTLSAGETFVLQMRALPTVTHIGETTRGALSDVLFKPLPNGWMLRLSNEVYRDSEGILWEGPGITPEVSLPVFSTGDLHGHSATLRSVLDWLNQVVEG